MFILSESISVQNLSSLTLKTKELWKGGWKTPPPPSATTRQKSPVLIGLKAPKYFDVIIVASLCHHFTTFGSSMYLLIPKLLLFVLKKSERDASPRIGNQILNNFVNSSSTGSKLGAVAAYGNLSKTGS